MMSMTPQETIAAARPRRWRRWIGYLVLAGALSACQAGRPLPLFSPLQATEGEYGYADRRLDGGRYEVSYTGPSQRSLRSEGARQEMDAAERTQAYDLALWHAAQITLGQGFAGFRVSNIRTNVDSRSDDFYDPFYAPGAYPNRRFGGPFGPYWGPYGGPSPYVYTQTQVVIDVDLLRSVDAGAYDANETIGRLTKIYPDAVGPKTPPAG